MALDLNSLRETLLEKKRARRRLTGAVALVLLVVIVLPMVLDKAHVAVAPVGEAERAQAALRDESWVIPMGTFANPANVKQLQAKLGSVGIKSLAEQVKTAQGEVIRVRAGPFKAKADAEKARGSIKAAGLDAGAVTTR